MGSKETRLVLALPDTFRDRLPADRMQFVEMYIHDGEWPMGIDYLVSNLADARVSISTKEHEDLLALRDEMEYPELLDELNVVDVKAG